jgi:hypothetical protein
LAGLLGDVPNARAGTGAGVRATSRWVKTATSLEAGHVVAAASKWGRQVGDRDPESSGPVPLRATSLGIEFEVDKMGANLAQICMIAGWGAGHADRRRIPPRSEQFRAAVAAKHG